MKLVFANGTELEVTQVVESILPRNVMEVRDGKVLELGIPEDCILSLEELAEMFTKDAAVECLEKGMVVFFAGGTGHPYFSTDTTTTLRAIEIEADMILLAKAIDGVYDSDPKLNPQAKKYDEISIQTVIDKKLGVMDLTASIMCMENKMPMLVFGLNEEDSILRTVHGEFSGTKVTI